MYQTLSVVRADRVSVLTYVRWTFKKIVALSFFSDLCKTRWQMFQFRKLTGNQSEGLRTSSMRSQQHWSPATGQMAKKTRRALNKYASYLAAIVFHASKFDPFIKDADDTICVN